MNVPFASAGSDGVTGGMSDESTVVTRLYAGDELIDESPFQAVQREVPATDGWADYRFEMDTTRPDRWRLGDAHVDGVGLPGADEPRRTTGSTCRCSSSTTTSTPTWPAA